MIVCVVCVSISESIAFLWKIFSPPLIQTILNKLIKKIVYSQCVYSGIPAKKNLQPGSISEIFSSENFNGCASHRRIICCFSNWSYKIFWREFLVLSILFWIEVHRSRVHIFAALSQRVINTIAWTVKVCIVKSVCCLFRYIAGQTSRPNCIW